MCAHPDNFGMIHANHYGRKAPTRGRNRLHLQRRRLQCVSPGEYFSIVNSPGGINRNVMPMLFVCSIGTPRYSWPTPLDISPDAPGASNRNWDVASARHDGLGLIQELLHGVLQSAGLVGQQFDQRGCLLNPAGLSHRLQQACRRSHRFRE